MPRIAYRKRNFTPDVLAIIEMANTILDEYIQQGYDLTLRQLYYQFVARGLIENRQREYDRLGTIINNGRLAGLIDWSHITDRTRNIHMNAHWDFPSDGVKALADQYQIDKWKDQSLRVEVWIEKDALIGVIEPVCQKQDVSCFSCRGYVSQSEMWQAAQRVLRYNKDGQEVIILHLGDHDPSGVDMSRDIQDRLSLLTWNGSIEVIRIALSIEQVQEFDPPPNPVKFTDSRSINYANQYGDESWELDALDPATLTALIEENVKRFRQQSKWRKSLARERKEKRGLAKAAKRWDKILSFLEP